MTIQILQIFLLVGQVFLSPYFIDGIDFSRALLLLAPAMLAQGFYEPVCQAFFGGSGGRYIKLPTLFFLVVVLFFYLGSYLLGGFSDFSILNIFLAVIYGCAYLFQTLVFSSLYSAGMSRVIATSLAWGVVSYYVTFFSFVGFELGFHSYIAANFLFVFVSGFVALFCMRKCKFMSFFRGDRYSVLAFSSILVALVRVPVVSLNTLFVLIIGLFSLDWRVVVAYKLLTSAVNALKYTSPMPAGTFYATVLSGCHSAGIARFFLQKPVLFNVAAQSFAAILGVVVFPIYWGFLYPGEMLPSGWWLVIVSGVAFQMLQPFLMLVNIRLGVRSLLLVVAVFSAIAFFLINIDPFVAFSVSVWVTLAVSIFLLSKSRVIE